MKNKNENEIELIAERAIDLLAEREGMTGAQIREEMQAAIPVSESGAGTNDRTAEAFITQVLLRLLSDA